MSLRHFLEHGSAEKIAVLAHANDDPNNQEVGFIFEWSGSELWTLIKYSRSKIKNKKPIAGDVLFKAYPMVPHSHADPIWPDGTFKVGPISLSLGEARSGGRDVGRCSWSDQSALDPCSEQGLQVYLPSMTKAVFECRLFKANNCFVLRSIDQLTIKEQNPKCRLYRCLIEFIDWRYSQSSWYLRPLLWTSAPLTFSLVHLSSPPPFPVWISTGVCIHTVCNRGDGTGSVESIYRSYVLYTLCIWPDSEPTKLLYHPKQKPRREGTSIDRVSLEIFGPCLQVSSIIDLSCFWMSSFHEK